MSIRQSSLYSQVNYSSHNDIPDPYHLAHIYGKCGIIAVRLIDPLSQLIDKINGLHDNDVNSIGFYYEAELHGISKCTVILFNTYDNDSVPWLKLGYTMDLLLASPFVTKITYYPLVHDSSQNNSRSGTSKLEEIFRTVVVQTIGTNAKAIHDKNISYTVMLLKIAGITGEEVDRLSTNLITGYSLVNKVLLTLMGIDKADFNKISSSVVSCPLLKQPISIVAPRDNISDNDVKYIVEESRREITKLVAIFVDLFTSHDPFRENVLATHSHKFKGSLMDKDSTLDILFNHEQELISNIVVGLQNGIIDNSNLNDIIYDITKERANLGNYRPLVLSLNPKKNVQVTNEDTMCTFASSNKDRKNHEQQLSQKNDALRGLGQYIEYIVETFNTSDALTINLGGIITAYNNIVHDTNINKIELLDLNNTTKPKTYKHTISRSAIVTIAGDSSVDDIKVPMDSGTITIPMYDCNFNVFTEMQLLDILIYIDSLRDSNGTTDNRFSNIQNEVTHELAQRRRSRFN